MKRFAIVTAVVSILTMIILVMYAMKISPGWLGS